MYAKDPCVMASQGRTSSFSFIFSLFHHNLQVEREKKRKENVCAVILAGPHLSFKGNVFTRSLGTSSARIKDREDRFL